jgi:hypothetical protein
MFVSHNICEMQEKAGGSGVANFRHRRRFFIFNIQYSSLISGKRICQCVAQTITPRTNSNSDAQNPAHRHRERTIALAHQCGSLLCGV